MTVCVDTDLINFATFDDTIKMTYKSKQHSSEKSSSRKNIDKRDTHSNRHKSKHKSVSPKRRIEHRESSSRSHHREKREIDKREESKSDGLSFNKGYFLEKVESSELQKEFELSNYSKAYGLDLSGFVGLSSEILSIGSISKDKEYTKAERKKFREEEIKLHKDRFWKCKKCSFMNYLSNYACMGCKGLKGACSSR
ncbi:conserved hypothetical protein [Theileria equi strain WA]|uniref:RanBP2-type domain-containing protein n=1 Tax=Theileria equi strain WA TaxID=1537102 RepID=L1LDF6_THEEQ|nr:conserved hypothetical protein [Theileria equi strain WA]EKX73265.1 conserved hypothetical protein [Theileria equi strain WA]|eukprot:XP_004832717.1 conserved hypothetical protein [Theileria equi strain WA]